MSATDRLRGIMHALPQLVVALSLATLAACGSTPMQQPQQQPGTAAQPHLVVPTPSSVAQPVVVTIFDAAALLPIVGLGKVDADQQKGRSIGELLADYGLDATLEFRGQFAHELTARSGSSVATLDVKRATPGAFKLMPDQNELPMDPADECFVDVHLVYGFVAAASGKDYKPYMVANLQIIRSDTHKVSYQGKYFYNFLGRKIDIRPTTTFPTWQNSALIEADIPGAANALRNAITDLAAGVAEHLQATHRLSGC